MNEYIRMGLEQKSGLETEMSTEVAEEIKGKDRITPRQLKKTGRDKNKIRTVV